MGILKSQLGNTNIDITPRTETESIRISMIQEHPDNFFSTDEEDLHLLAEDIKENGLNSRILVRRLSPEHPFYRKDKPFQALGGHRRRRAVQKLGWEFIDAKIRECDDLTAHEIVITDNLTAREITAKERLQAVEHLTSIYKNKKKTEGMPGRVQDLVARALNLSGSQVQRYDVVLRKGSDRLRDAVLNEEISVKNAVEIASLDFDDQDTLLNLGYGNNPLKIKEFKDNLKQLDSPIFDSKIDTSVDILETAEPIHIEKAKEVEVDISDPLPGQMSINDYIDETNDFDIEPQAKECHVFEKEILPLEKTANKILDELEDMMTSIQEIFMYIESSKISMTVKADIDIKLRISQKSVVACIAATEALLK